MAVNFSVSLLFTYTIYLPAAPRPTCGQPASPSPAAFPGLWPGIQVTVPWAPWQGGLFSCSLAFVEEGGAGLGTAVCHKPLNKAANEELPVL